MWAIGAHEDGDANAQDGSAADGGEEPPGVESNISPGCMQRCQNDCVVIV